MLAACIIAGGLAFAEDIQVTSTFDKRSAHVGEEIRLSIRIDGATGNIQAPRLPSFEGFDTFYTGRASHITFVNGRSSSTVEFSYVLVPRTAGNFTLNPIDVTVQGRVFRTEPITIDVSQGQAPPQMGAQNNPMLQPLNAPPPSAPRSAPVSNAGPQAPIQPPTPTTEGADDNIFVQAWVDKNSVYPNQQVLLTYSLYTRYDTRYEGFEQEPEISGFWIEEFPMEREVERETVTVNGKRYVKADIRKIALFPTSAADYTVKPGVIRASIRQQPQQTSIFDDFFDDSFFSGGSFFARRENRLLTPQPIQIKVKPLPEQGKPASFSGAVGDFKMTATLDKTSVQQNEPVTMTLVLEGQGNLETMNRPNLPEFPDFKVYDGDASTQLYKSGVVIGGKKTFEVVFIPKKAGSMTIPPVEFSFFNPQAQRYVPLKTPEFKLDVKPSDKPFEIPRELSKQDVFKKDVKAEGQDIRYIHERLPDERTETIVSGLYYLMLGLDILMAAWLILTFLQHRTERIYEKDNALRRRRQAKSQALSKAGKLRPLMNDAKDETGRVFFQEADKVLTQYLADKFNLSALGGTRMEVERELAKRLGTQDPLYKEIMDLYNIFDESRFGMVKVDKEIKHRALDVIRKSVQRMEKICR
jgi:hypothetical protein